MSPEKKRNLLDKGAILQRDGQTYALTPRIPCGLITDFDLLRRIADAAEKHGADLIKITSAQRLAVIGIAEEEIDGFWADLGLDAGIAFGLCIRGIKACPGTSCCRLGKQPSLEIGIKLEERFNNLPVPNKMKIAVSGCPMDCAEAQVRDIGLVGTRKGFKVLVGGQVGVRPRIGELLAEDVSPEEVEPLVARIVERYRAMGVKKRLGPALDAAGGLEAFRAQILDES